MKISISASNKYSACGKMYEYHYIKKLRPNWTSSALLFGDALDKALNELVTRSGKDAYETFLKGWTHGFINKKFTFIPTATKLLYANQDYESTLLTEDDYQQINERVAKGEVKEFQYEELVDKKKKGWDSLTEEEKAYYNLVNWHCMKNKARHILQGYEQKILPKIKKVHAVQKEIRVANSDGDEFIGFVDLIADLEGYGTVILDHKTSARHYEPDAVKKSAQLAIYLHMEGQTYNTKNAGFIVMKKKLNMNKIKTCESCGHIGEGSHKTCNNTIANPEGKEVRCGGKWKETTNPEAEFQIIVDSIESGFENMVVDNIDDSLRAIKAGVFVRNLDTCHNYFGSTCPYLTYCKSSCKNKTGLVEESED